MCTPGASRPFGLLDLGAPSRRKIGKVQVPAAMERQADHIHISIEQLTAWADSCLHKSHLGTLVQREIEGGDLGSTTDLSKRSRGPACHTSR